MQQVELADGVLKVASFLTFTLGIIVLFVGMTLTRKVKILEKYNIPPAVTGGLICSIIVAIVSAVFDCWPNSASQTPAVLVVVYGNRAYDDALLELSDIATGAGFVPLAAGAFVGEQVRGRASHAAPRSGDDRRASGDGTAQLRESRHARPKRTGLARSSED